MTDGPIEGPENESLREKFLREQNDTVLDTKVQGTPPVRGPFGEATITPRPGVVPKKQRMYQFQGARRAEWDDKIREFDSPVLPGLKEEARDVPRCR